MNIVITGHKGYIGSHLTKRLRNLVTGIDLKDGQDILTCDLPGADMVIHLAAQVNVVRSMSDPIGTAKTNTYGPVRLWKRYRDVKFIFASTGGAIQDDQNPPYISPYGLSKFCAEEYIKMLFSNYVILRFANVYGGEGSRSVVDAFLKSKESIIYGDGSETRTYVHVDDVVDGIIEAMNWPVGTYKLGSDQNYSLKEIAVAVGHPIKYAPMRAGEFKHSHLENTTPNWKADIKLMDYIYARTKPVDTK